MKQNYLLKFFVKIINFACKKIIWKKKVKKLLKKMYRCIFWEGSEVSHRPVKHKAGAQTMNQKQNKILKTDLKIFL